MALLDIFKDKKKKADEKLKRPPKGVFKQSERKKPEIIKEDKKREDKPLKKQRESLLASEVILSPHTTEKSALSAENGAYVFRVASGTNKVIIKRAIEEFYGFKPEKISITNIPSKKRINRGKVGIKPGFKKAVVYLKKGDEIDIT